MTTGAHPLTARQAEDPQGRVGWQVTAAHQRALLLGGVAALAAIVSRRIDLLVLAVPMLVVATWGWAARPRATAAERHPASAGRHTGSDVVARASVGNRTLPEGTATRWRAEIELPPGAEEVTVRLSPGYFVAVDPRAELDSLARPDNGVVRVGIVARTTRWGPRRIGPGLVQARSAWWAYRTAVLQVGRFAVTATPASGRVEVDAPTPHPEGLVGVNRSARPGSGSELAAIRPWQPGDRLRRIHWPSSLREQASGGTLQVRTNYADEDAHVVLVVDALSDIGPREGIDGRPTSLDLTVRACAALAHHWLGAGDRVSLRVLGSADLPRLGSAAGAAQLRRIVDVLARISPATDRELTTVRALDGLVSGSLVVVLTPLVHPALAGVVLGAAARGLATVVIDTLPDHLGSADEDVYTELAWRIRRLDRRDELERLRAAGVPVVPWRGPGSLDLVLRDLARRARAPRVVRR
ncbi:MAG TPA: DUF58 domain-containing protein [Dermatophilaceae bacterium]|nr:DUF58 domain-containing protein [Dermatophilaceae bacterium]